MAQALLPFMSIYLHGCFLGLCNPGEHVLQLRSGGYLSQNHPSRSKLLSMSRSPSAHQGFSEAERQLHAGHSHPRRARSPAYLLKLGFSSSPSEKNRTTYSCAPVPPSELLKQSY